jgi:hypothetical protein
MDYAQWRIGSCRNQIMLSGIAHKAPTAMRSDIAVASENFTAAVAAVSRLRKALNHKLMPDECKGRASSSGVSARYSFRLQLDTLI